MALSLKGIINADGSIQAGCGFKCQKAGRGFYAIEFDVPFDAPPIAICMLCDSASDAGHYSVSIINIAACQFVCATTSPHAPEDLAFKFIVLSHTQHAHGQEQEV